MRKSVNIIMLILFALFPVCYAENYLIVTPEKFKTSIQPIGDYRAKEYNVSYYIYQGENATALKDKILPYNPDYVLIVGSNATVPSLNNNDRNYNSKIGRVGVDWDYVIGQYARKVVKYETEEQYKQRRVGLIAGSEAIPVTGFRTATFFAQDIKPLLNNYTFHESYCYCALGCPNALFNAVKLLESNTLVLYTGHSAITGWDAGCGERLFQRDLNNMTSQYNPIVMAFSCSSVRYTNQLYLANRLLMPEREGIGAVAYLGSLFPIGTDGYKLNFSATTLGEFLEHSNLPSSYVIMGDPAVTMNEQIIIQNNVSNGSFIIDTNYTYINHSTMSFNDSGVGVFADGNVTAHLYNLTNTTICMTQVINCSTQLQTALDLVTIKESLKNMQLQKYQIIDLIVVLLNKI